MRFENKMDWRCRGFLSLLGAAVLVWVLPPLNASAEDELNLNQVKEINRLIHDYLMAHPQVIVESVQKLREQEEVTRREQGASSLEMFRDQLENDPLTPVAGNPNGDVTITEFFDYRCGYCKSTLSVVLQLLAEDSGVRLVLKEFPILSAESTIAAHAALAAGIQGKYFKFHNALMQARGSLGTDQIMDIAAQSGLDTIRLAMDMETPRVQAQVDANHELAASLGIRGTPTFVIGDQILPGAIDIDTLRQIIQMMRSG